MTPHVLVIVQNLSVPLDRRVWLECQALRDADYRVSVICPMGPGETAEEVLDGVRIHRYPPPPAADSAAGFAREFAYCWAATAVRAVRIWRRERFDVIQACNPPDTYWALARLFGPFGVKFVFDHHDLNPELFLSRFGIPSSIAARLQLRGLRWLERRTLRSADHVLSTNTSYADIALRRGGRRPDEVTVVRSGPDTRRMRPLARAAPALEVPEGKHVLAYIGIMGPQDGIDVLLRSLAILFHDLGRTDAHAVLMGFGDSMESMRELAMELDLTDNVTFTGRVDARMLGEVLSAAAIGLGPDPSSPLNDLSTMNKTMEYMAYALPIVTFDLPETRNSAGTAARYVEPGDERAFAQAIDDLLDDLPARIHLGLAARARAVAELDWAAQRAAYLTAYERVTGYRAPAPRAATAAEERRRRTIAPVDEWGRPFVDLRAQTALPESLRERAVV